MPELEDVSIIAWIDKHGIKTENGMPYDFRSHMFWFDILADQSPHQVWLKAAQMGGTTTAILKLFWTMAKKGVNAIYTMPTDGDVRDLVSGKVNPIVANNQVLQQYVRDHDTIEQKRVGQHTAYFRGTWTSRAALSISSDLNVHDEEDRSNRLIVDQYSSRLQHSPWKMEWHYSNPSSVGNGVDKYWKDSDQKHWFITCSRCKHKQFLSWPDSIDVGRRAFVCKKCREVLSDEDRRVGEWHAKKSAVKPKYSGYWLSLLMAPWITAEYIIELHQKKSAEYFANFVLGLPYSGAGSKITEDEFFANLSAMPYKAEDPIVIGVDTGLPIWYVVGNKEGVFSAGHCDGYDELERMLNRWPKAVMVADQGGDLIGIRELQEKYPGRVFLCHYRRDRKTMGLIEWGKGAEVGNVVVDRNRMIQLVMDELRAKRVPLLGSKEEWWETWLHFANAYRTVDEDQLGQEIYVWERSGPDHLMHAFTYWRVGMDKFGLFGGVHHVDAGPPMPDVPYGVYVMPASQKGEWKPPPQENSDWRQV